MSAGIARFHDYPGLPGQEPADPHSNRMRGIVEIAIETINGDWIETDLPRV